MVDLPRMLEYVPIEYHSAGRHFDSLERWEAHAQTHRSASGTSPGVLYSESPNLRQAGRRQLAGTRLRCARMSSVCPRKRGPAAPRGGFASGLAGAARIGVQPRASDCPHPDQVRSGEFGSSIGQKTCLFGTLGARPLTGGLSVGAARITPSTTMLRWRRGVEPTETAGLQSDSQSG